MLAYIHNCILAFHTAFTTLNSLSALQTITDPSPLQSSKQLYFHDGFCSFEEDQILSLLR